MHVTITSDDFPDLPDEAVALYVTMTGWPVYCVPRGSVGIPLYVFCCAACGAESYPNSDQKTAADANTHAATCRRVRLTYPADAPQWPSR